MCVCVCVLVSGQTLKKVPRLQSGSAVESYWLNTRIDRRREASDTRRLFPGGSAKAIGGRRIATIPRTEKNATGGETRASTAEPAAHGVTNESFFEGGIGSGAA